jgi:tetratricopeptide (TPR) repeat protein
MPDRAQIEKLLSASPEDDFLNFALAMAMVKDQQFEDAIRQFSRTLEVNPEYIAAYFQRSNALVSLDRIDEAKQSLREGIEVANRIGDTHAAGEMSEALGLLEK